MTAVKENSEVFARWFSPGKITPVLKSLYEAFASGSICIDVPTKLPKDKLIGNLADHELKPFIVHNNKLYMQRYFVYETSLLDHIRELSAVEEKEVKTRFQFLKTFKSTGKRALNEWQQAGAYAAFLNNFSIITGGPGTGKTTTVASVLEMIFSENPGANVALVAPTGKAANRMAESVRNASSLFDSKFENLFESVYTATIHRLLGYIPKSLYFRHHADHKLLYDVVIVDECSMIDIALFSKLLSAIKPGTKLILLGDKDQLSAVEAGSVFGDICKSVRNENTFHESIAAYLNKCMNHTIDTADETENIVAGRITTLTESHRFKTNEGIGKLAAAVLNNREEEIKNFLRNTDPQVTIDTGFSNELFESFIAGYEKYISEPDIVKALEAFNELRILCATKMGDRGVYAVNQKTELYLQKKGLLSPGEIFYENRPVMLTKNYNDLQIFNGETGIVRADVKGNKWIWFIGSDNNIRQVLPGYVTAIETAFAMTIHKSQGSEYEKVMMMLPDNAESKILTAELVYTGITRAKKKVIVQSSEEALLSASDIRVQRASGILERLRNGEMN